MTTFDYSNLSGREPGAFLRTAGVLIPGVRSVQAQVAPYAAWWQEQNHRALDADGPLWVALGDSMTQGIGASAPDRGWVGQLMPELPFRVVNLAVSGGLTSDVIERQIPAMASLGVAPDLVTLMIGSNDLFNRRARPGLVERTEQLVPLLPDGTVVATLPQPRAAARAFNHVVESAGHLRTAEYRDPRMNSWRGKLAADRFHPNDRGYAGMAQIMREAIAGG